MPPTNQSRSKLLRLCLFALLPAAVLGAAERFSHYFGLPIEVLLRDPGAVADTPYYVGFVSNIGVVLWCAGACFSLFGAMVLREVNKAHPARWFLLSAGLFTALLMLDDCFMLHESALPHLFGLPEHTLIVVYAVWGLTMTWRCRHTILNGDTEVYVVAVVMLGMSVFIDMLPQHFLGDWTHAVEDGLKLIGISFWMTYFALTARRLTVEVTKPASPKVQRILGPLRRHSRGETKRARRSIISRRPRPL